MENRLKLLLKQQSDKKGLKEKAGEISRQKAYECKKTKESK